MQGTAQSIRAASMFELYVRTVWPLHRRFVKQRLSKRCAKCAASAAIISLDVNGICALCQKPTSNTSASPSQVAQETTAVAEILRAHQGQGQGAYDALVAYSGGKDSSYLIRRIQTEFSGLRLLAFTMDNGFMSPVAKENIEELLPKLGVDHLFIRPRREFYVSLFRYCLTHLNKEGGYGTVDFSDGEFMLDSARELAAERRIPLILCGYSRYQVQNGLRLHGFESPRERELCDRVDTAGLSLADIFPDEIDRKRWWQASRHPPEAVARLLFPLYAWNLEESEIKNQVTAWGLLRKTAQSPIVTNHRLIPLLGVVDVHQLGYSSFEIELCRMVREGKADRREWQRVFELLEHSAKTGLFVRTLVLDSLAELGLTPADVRVPF